MITAKEILDYLNERIKEARGTREKFLSDFEETKDEDDRINALIWGERVMAYTEEKAWIFCTMK